MKTSLLGGTGSFAEGLAIRCGQENKRILIGSRKIEKAQEEVGKMLLDQNSGNYANIVGFVMQKPQKTARLGSVFACHPNILSQL